MNIINTVKNAAFNTALTSTLHYLEKDPEINIPKAMDLIDKVVPDGWYESQRAAFRKAITEKNNWYQLILKTYQLDEGVRKTFFRNFIMNSALKGSAIQEEIAQRENCNVPWAILLDPTSACNLHCTGCWAAEYGHKLSLSLDTIDNIIQQGKELGTYMYIYTGGEPMVRKKDLITLCERHPDCEFLSFTNGTLIDEEFCKEMIRVKNFVPAISLEGFEGANDGRRGKGVFTKVQNAMKLLKKHNLPFGISTCYTSANYQDITSEAFFDMLIDAGAMFVWFFHYMPVGNDAVPALLPTPEQRKLIYERIRRFREDQLLEIAAYAEDYSNHPISQSIKKAYNKVIDSSRIQDVQEIAGHGVHAIIDGQSVFAGNTKLMELEGITIPYTSDVGTLIYIAVDNKYWGHIVIEDEIKPDAAEAITSLKSCGVRQTIMLTGDSDAVGQKVASKLGLDHAYTELLPADKVERVERLLSGKNDKTSLAFVGDGINDAPVLARADVGIAMGGLGSDAAIEAADVVLMTDEPSKIATVIKIARKTLRIAHENIVFALAVKFLVLFLGAIGYASMWAAVFADVGVSVIAILNAIRAMNVKKYN